MAELLIAVEVAYARSDQQMIIPLQITQGGSVADAIEQSGIISLIPEINLMTNKVGIFGKVCSLDRQLRSGDRVEIYWPLKIDPKESRRQRAAKSNH
ncbi:MAG: RnfH family protein [Methylococcales bacterium]|nr:RnfH family protein [Methylococcaceae bacterium]HIL39970.1 RnfH family protein [Methylococcales bacterium]